MAFSRRGFLGSIAALAVASKAKAVAAPVEQPKADEGHKVNAYTDGGGTYVDFVASQSFHKGDIVMIDMDRPKYALRFDPKRRPWPVCGIAMHNADALTRVRVMVQGTVSV